MRLRQLPERRISSSAAGESLRPLSAPEVELAAGAAYDGGPVIIADPIPCPVYPTPDPEPLPFPRGPIGYLP